MREEFLHFIWREARFDLRDLRTTTGQSLSIQHFGEHNKDAGPDFSGGQLRIDGMQWAGNIEIHLRASDWYRHQHEQDPAYNNVILHVVLEEDRPVYHPDGQRIPCLELQERIPAGLLHSWWRLQHNAYWIPCQHQLPRSPTTVVTAMLDRVLQERVQERSQTFRARLERNNMDWEEAFYEALARALGGRVNADAMDMLARSLPLRVMLKHKHSLLQLEALLFGQSGLLPEVRADEEVYVTLLRREYTLLKTKHNLRPLPATAWRYLRLRPSNFPTVRIAEFAVILFRTGQLFSKVLSAADATELENMFVVQLSNYWQSHYRFGKSSKPRLRNLGQSTIHSILINTIAPALFTYANYRSDDRFQERALNLLRSLPPEDNHVIRKWKQLSVEVAHAADSQALLQLKADYCQKSRCLECTIGCHILNKHYDAGEAPLLSLQEETALYNFAESY